MRPTPTSSYRCHEEFVSQKETMRIVEVAPPANPAPLVPTIAGSRRDLVEIIHKRSAKEFQGSKEDGLVVAENWLFKVYRVFEE
ncbi:hypothetical protein GOBAR_AA15445 [Gossypium barbadense]|uniref:Uncharacterized protein n=1 Tax=Gossypium barbadense TaxID=3634 RepID=A0A2P5XPG2_GOSBA|nr:hypothetical protein GOBAR_AA15445 [Gossypium barbadense]